MSVSIQMPKWKCHKEVWALKIRGIGLEVTGQHQFYPEDDRYGPINVSEDYIDKYKPKPGGYFIVYEGGQKLYLSAEVFEQIYSPA